MGIALSAAHQYNFVDRIVSQLYHRAHPPTPAATTNLNYCSPIEYTKYKTSGLLRRSARREASSQSSMNQACVQSTNGATLENRQNMIKMKNSMN